MDAVFPAEAFDCGCAFVREHGRALDAAWLDLVLGRGPADAVVMAVAAYQNADGGFGNGIEPDLRTPASTAIATTVGLRALRAAGVDARHEGARAAIAWLVDAVDRERWVWPIVTPAVDEAPHAPWWTWSEDLAASWNGFRFNPSAEALGYLYDYAELVPADVLHGTTRRLLDDLDGQHGPRDYYETQCLSHLHDSRALPDAIREQVRAALYRAVSMLDPDDLHANYTALIPDPDSVLAAAYGDRLHRALVEAVASQDGDGGWTPFWDWSSVNRPAWRRALAEWRGVLARDILSAAFRHGAVAR